MSSWRGHRRGLTIVEVLVLLACLVALVAMGLPAFQRLGCSAMRMTSRANLALLSEAHAMYAIDWSNRQFTFTPDTLGVAGGNTSAWEQLNGCVPQALLGEDHQGVPFRMGTECADLNLAEKDNWIKPLSFGQDFTTKTAYRLANARLVNVYLNGRFYDPLFYAPDDPLVTEELRDAQKQGADFAELSTGLIPSTYAYSPAAMYDPRVFGLGWSGTNPPWRNPDADPFLGGMGYQSPSVTQCVYPSLKTKLMEMWTIENPRIPCMNYSPPGECVPLQWNHSYRSRPLTLFFDGSVRIMTPREPQYAEQLSTTKLWLRTTPLGSHGYLGGSADDFLVRTSAHFLTTFGIAGRDTISY